MKKLTILVVDDNPKNIEAAKEQFTEHDIIAFQSAEEAEVFLGGHAGLLNTLAEDSKAVRFVEEYRLGKKSAVDVALFDLMMPPPRKEVSGDLHREAIRTGEQYPIGIFLSIFATIANIPIVGLLTDTNHHYGFMPSMLNLFQKDISVMQSSSMRLNVEGMKEKPAPIKINDSFVFLSNNREWFDRKTGKKDWESFLAYMLEQR